MSLEQFGIKVEVTRDADGTPVVNVLSPVRIYLELNGNLVAGESKRIPKQTFWAPDGSKVDTTIDLRGEER